MTQAQFLTLAKTGDFNALWTAVENHTAGAQTELVVAKTALEKERDDLKLLTKDSRLAALEASRANALAQADKLAAEIAKLDGREPVTNHEATQW